MPAKDTTRILTQLRALMKEGIQMGSEARKRVLSAYVIPSADAHSSEYLSERDERRSFVSGFTGSAGTCVVTLDRALLWTDGRYFLQAEQELDPVQWELMRDGLAETPSIGEWLARNLPPASLVGIDATLYQDDLYVGLETKMQENRLELVHTKQNLVDLVWVDRAKQEMKPLIQLKEEFCGKSCSEKLQLVRDQLKAAQNAYCAVITSLDEIAWLLNVRGFDIPFGTVFFAYAIVTQTCLKLFTDLTRLSDAIRASLVQQEPNIEFYEYDTFYEYFESFVQRELCGENNNDGVVRKAYLSNSSNHFVHSLVPSSLVHKDLSIVAKLKIIKNANEIESAKRVHLRDSITLVELFYKLDKHFAPNSSKDYFGFDLNEFSLSAYLDKLRGSRAGFLNASFETICGLGSNGAVIHYKPQLDERNKRIEPNNLVLIDSGGHYVDMGTTDVTRTVYLGDKTTVSDYQRECFTRVLKGHIQLAICVFPSNTRAELLDSFARQALWRAGLDYRHGTGHGVGALLNVHEVPIMGNRKSIELGLRENMIVTIEPGFYQDNEFGIRIENCVRTVKAETKYKFGSVDFITFEPLTLVPIQRELVDKSLLDASELEWLNQYHARCAQLVGEQLKSEGLNDVYEWLLEQTKPI